MDLKPLLKRLNCHLETNRNPLSHLWKEDSFRAGRKTPGPLQNPIKQMCFSFCSMPGRLPNLGYLSPGEEQIPKVRPPEGLSWQCSASSIFGWSNLISSGVLSISSCSQGSFRKFWLPLQDCSEQKCHVAIIPQEVPFVFHYQVKLFSTQELAVLLFLAHWQFKNKAKQTTQIKIPLWGGWWLLLGARTLGSCLSPLRVFLWSPLQNLCDIFSVEAKPNS